jgi:hypothetical protein
MTVIQTATYHTIRTRQIVYRDNGLKLSDKSVSFFVAAVPSNEAGTVIAATPAAEIEVSASVQSILTDPETAADAAIALAALDRIGAVICGRTSAAVAAKLSPPQEQP